MGDATVATVEKGRLWLDRAVAEIAEYIEELAVREPRPGRDHHETSERATREDQMRARRLIAMTMLAAAGDDRCRVWRREEQPEAAAEAEASSRAASCASARRTTSTP